MGRLVAKAYPTDVAPNLADHTYVECGAGAKAWGCWGGKTGGHPLGSGDGSTLRADAIAEPDERAGITCYAINGVCHQAANRILLAAGGITVIGARGYGLSVALFGVYGRPSGPFGLCAAPLDSHPMISGDLDECRDVGPYLGESGAGAELAMRMDSLGLYSQPGLTRASTESRIGFQLAQFRIFAMHRLREFPAVFLDGAQAVQLRFENARTRLEDQLGPSPDWAGFVDALNGMTKSYQQAMAEVLNKESYIALLDCQPGESLIVCNPDIVRPPPNPAPRRGPSRP